MMDPLLPDIQLLRSMQLFSAALPVGGFSYSQGLETAVEKGWVADVHDVDAWLSSQLRGPVAHQELPLLLRCYQCCCCGNWSELEYWSAFALACRDTQELRAEERARGKALLKWWVALQHKQAHPGRAASGLDTDLDTDRVAESSLAVFALAAAGLAIRQRTLMAGFVQHWLESQIISAVKLVPIGQSQGQVLLYRLASDIPWCCDAAELVVDDDIGYTMPAQSVASVAHESQYSRNYRS